MRGSWRLWSTVAVLGTCHFLLHVGLGLGPEAPDLLTMALLIGARGVGTGTGAALGFGLGLLEDAMALLAFGRNALAMALVGALGARTRDLFVGDSALFVFAYLAVGKWLRDLVYWLVVGETVREPFVETMLLEGPLLAVYAAMFGFIAVLASGSWWEPMR